MDGRAAVAGRTFLAVAFVLGATSARAQCSGGSSFASVPAPTTTTPTAINSCNWAGDYNTITGAVAGRTYQFTSSPSSYLTIRQGSPTGTVLAFGTAPVSATVTVNGPLYMLMTTGPACGTATTCLSTTVACTTCAVPDLTVSQTSSAAGGWVPSGVPWSWRPTVANTGTADATFPAGTTLLAANLPSSGFTYGTVAVINPSGITGTIACAMTGADLACAASGGPVTVAAPTGAFTVDVTTTAAATGTFTSPRSGGSVRVDPGTAVAESNEANNNAAPLTVNVGAPATAGQLVLGEFRLSGPGGAGDEYVVLYNATAAAHTVVGSDGSNGYAVAASDDAPRFAVPNGTVIPAHGYVLGANGTAYSLGAYPSGGTPDFTFTTGVADDTGLALYNTANPASFGAAQVIDAAGFTGLPGGSRYREGSGLAPVAGSTAEHAWARRLKRDGLLQDTNDNAADFVLVATSPTAINGSTPVFGAPAPRNLAGPRTSTASFASSVLDPLATALASPNRERPTTSGTSPQTLGTMKFRQSLRNTTGATVTRLRFRVFEITTTGSPLVLASPQAQLRVLGSTDEAAVTITGGGTVAVKGATLETPPSPALSGGLDSSVTVNVGGGLANGATMNVSFLVGVEAKGNFSFFLVWEALP